MNTAETTTTAPAAGTGKPASGRRTLLLVAGSGRSGTSLFSGLLQRLGFHIPQPEVPADASNPRGFAESQWVVDFHARWLKRAAVQSSDARPAAWAQVAEVALDESVVRQVGGWLGKQFREADHIVIKDPRLSWFLPLWRHAADEAGAGLRVATVLRHPAAVVDSKQRYYGAWQGDVTRTAGWVNQMLFTERATREMNRAFVRYEDLLDDWPRVVGGVAETLGLTAITEAPTSRLRDAHDFVDRGLSRSRTDWPEDLAMPAALREQADSVWGLMSQLADADKAEVWEKLDSARARYIDFYGEAESIAQSSVRAAREGGQPTSQRASAKAIRLVSKSVPQRYKQRIPPQWRTRILRVLHRPGGETR
jgi:hypothetical protein